MDPRRAQIERNAHFTRGPRFFREDDEVMFEFVIDATNTVGPRPATAEDKATHRDAAAAFWHSDEQSKKQSFAAALRHHAEMADEGRSFDGPVEKDPEQAAKLRAEAEEVDRQIANLQHPQGQPTGELPKRRKPRDAAA